MAAEPVFMAWMVSKLTLAFSMASTWLSTLNRAPRIFSRCDSYIFFLFNAIRAAITIHKIDQIIKER